MARILVVRPSGSPFAVRMSKVLLEMVDLGHSVDIITPNVPPFRPNVPLEMGWDLAEQVRIITAPCARDREARRTTRRILGTQLQPSGPFAQAIDERVGSGHYQVIWAKDSLVLPAVMAAAERSPSRPRVVCDIYENAPQQMVDRYIRFASWRSALLTRVQGLIPRLQAAERRCFPQCDHLFTVVEEMADHLVETYGLDPQRVSPVHNVERLADFDAIAPYRSSDKRPLVTYVGGIAGHRGLDTLIAAVPLLVKQLGSRFRVAIVGVRDDHRLMLQQELDEHNAQDVIVLIPWCTHREAMGWIKGSAIGIVPHRATGHVATTLPNKLFQYMSASVPVVCSDVGPLGRIPRETGGGLAVQPDTPESLADAIATLLASPDRARKMGEAGRLAVEQTYCWAVQRSAYVDYLKGLDQCELA